MKLYRPVGLTELEAIAATNYRGFPKGRGADSGIDLMLDREQAERMARDWHTNDAVSGFVGFLTELDLPFSLLGRYGITNATSDHRMLRIPSDDLDRLVARLPEPIRIVQHFTGSRFSGAISERTHLPVHLPVPEVDLLLPEPLASLIRSCETICLAGCCGVRAYDRTPENILPWVRRNGLDAAKSAATQAARLAKRFEHSWHMVLSSENDFNFRWEGEYVSVYLYEWAFNVERAVRGLGIEN